MKHKIPPNLPLMKKANKAPTNGKKILNVTQKENTAFNSNGLSPLNVPPKAHVNILTNDVPPIAGRKAHPIIAIAKTIKQIGINFETLLLFSMI